MARVCVPCIVLSVALLLASCATSYYDMGLRYTEQENYAAALQSFRNAYRQDPRDLMSVRELGVVCFRMGRYPQAEKILKVVEKKHPEDDRMLFYLAATYEKQDNLKDAIDAYSHYVHAAPWSEARDQVQAKLDLMIRKQIEQDSRDLMAMESSLNLEDIPENTLAVLSFKNIGNKSKLNPLEKGITDMMITDFSKVNALKVVERVRMQKMMEEMNLAQTGLVDESTAPRLGKLLGVSTLVSGTFVDAPNHQVRLDAGLIDTHTKSTIGTDEVRGNLTEIFKAEKRLVLDMIDRLQIELTMEEMDAIQQIPTENIFAFMAYSQGLDAEDKGLFDQANSLFSKAVQLDPGFAQAQQQLNQTTMITTGQTELSAIEKKVDQQKQNKHVAQNGTGKTVKKQNKQSVIAREVNLQQDKSAVGQMMHTAQVMDRGFLPGIDSRKAESEQSTTSFGSSVDIEVEIPIPASLR